ncbi:MAG: hypothetical protein WC373_10165 [Smithella sp.]|jgi:hypothetical protein
MKRFWLVLLALGMLFAFSSSVFAADVKFSGSFYAAGMYLDNTTVSDDVGPSTAFYYQRLRVNMDFVATPYLQLKTRFDVLERIWGQTRSAAGTVDPTSYGTRTENDNIAFDYAYIWYVSKIGIWQVGVLSDNVWGTTFGNNDEPEGQIHWMLVKMPFIAGVKVVKLTDLSASTTTPAPYGAQADVDADKYVAYGIYNFKANKVAGQVGLLGYYVRNAAFRPAFAAPPAFQYMQHIYGLIPYAKAKIGPVAVEAEAQYQWGKARDWESGIPADDVKISSWSAYVDALADLGMFYVGGTFAWIQGDDPSTAKAEGTQSGGRDWNPCLIMFNYDLTYWAGAIPGFGGTANANAMTNAWFGQIRGGVRPVKDLDIMASVSYAQADEDGGLDDEYGWEIDVTATYKITNNLSYMLGVGYWLTGDYYEGGIAGASVDDNFLVINKLTLTF